MDGDICWLLCAAGERARADWEALLNDLYRRGLQGNNLQLIVTAGASADRGQEVL